MRIQQAAVESGMTCHTLRYYEKSGLIYPIPRDSAGHRYYREHDIKWLHFVKCLKSTGMPLKEIQQYTAKMSDAENQATRLLDILQQHRMRLQAQLTETQQFLDHIDWKIDHYQTLISNNS